MRRITILYEDKGRPGGDTVNYGPHVFVVQCLCDRLNIDRRERLKDLILGVPRGGNGNVQKECKAPRPSFGRDGGVVLAVYGRGQDPRARQAIVQCMQDAGQRQIAERVPVARPAEDRLPRKEPRDRSPRDLHVCSRHCPGRREA